MDKRKLILIAKRKIYTDGKQENVYQLQKRKVILKEKRKVVVIAKMKS